jgi:hypothetical protein
MYGHKKLPQNHQQTIDTMETERNRAMETITGTETF